MDTENTASNSDKIGASKMSGPVISAVRLQRNQAEKQRRDRLNGYINELATLVPMVKNSSKPVDKVSVLRLAAAHMRLNISCLNPARFKSKLSVLPSSVISYLEILEKNMGGFIVATTFAGTVVFCSKSVEEFLGYQNIDFMGQSIYNYVPSKEISHFEKKISSVISRYKKGNLKKVSKSLVLHLQKRPLPRTNDISYQKVIIKISVHSNEAQNDPNKEEQVAVKGKKALKHKDFGTSALVLMFIEPVKSPGKIPMPFSLKQHDVYVTLHGIRGEIIEADHNISTITGYMPCDVLGKSAYEYIFETDVPIAQFAQKAMFTSNDGKGIITYRLKTFNLKYIFLQSTGFLFKDSANQIQRFVCYNRWLSDEEGERELKKFQERFSPASFAARQLEAQKNNSESKMVCLNSPEENSMVNGHLNDSSFSAHSIDVNRDSNNMSMPVAKRTKNIKSPINELNGNLNGNILGNDYNVEKMEVCSYYQSADLISWKKYVKQEKHIYDTLPQSLNSHEKKQDLSLTQFSNNYAMDGSDITYFNTRNGDVNYELFQEEKMPPYADVQLQDPYNTQTKQMPSSVQPCASYSYQELPSDHRSNFENLMPSRMSFYKVTDNGSYNNIMDMRSDQYNSTSPTVPFVKNNLKSHSYDHCNTRQIRLLDSDCTHQNGNSYHLNSSENGAYHNIQSPKIATYNNNFSSNGDNMYGSVNTYGKSLTKHDAFGFQKVINPKNAMLNCPESINCSKSDDSNISSIFFYLFRDKGNFLNIHGFKK
ncbi:Aryl hydrocarbon receptor nuclear like protein [Argiope bruennichi]|uniref:Aryl hydrocarbon receptor nuclear like protein n=1 Tax=Argiope bruennichi TaxID=94029 RepID=A0A8T0FX80_ARGBR|nr:Aryl hydrocarbon receptor nuclear like protein [Argiope bruennichi]